MKSPMTSARLAFGAFSTAATSRGCGAAVRGCAARGAARRGWRRLARSRERARNRGAAGAARCCWRRLPPKRRRKKPPGPLLFCATTISPPSDWACASRARTPISADRDAATQRQRLEQSRRRGSSAFLVAERFSRSAASREAAARQIRRRPGRGRSDRRGSRRATPARACRRSRRHR